MIRKPELRYPLYFIKLHLYHKALIFQLPTQAHFKFRHSRLGHGNILGGQFEILTTGLILQISHQTRTVGATQKALFMKDIM